ncbi:MAG: copper resistance protein NlpE N-terminal domain-containing protein, partial [Gammaproteobacteria bacterium]
MRCFHLALVAFALAGCQPERSADPATASSSEAAPATVVDMHTSRVSIDWAGSYEGLLPCAECADLHVKLILARDGSFEIVSRPLVRGAAPASERGQLDWGPGGNIIILGTASGEQRFAVGEGRLLLLEAGQTQPAWDRSEAILPQSAVGGHSPRQELGELLEDHRWMLVDATDANHQRLDALFPEPERSFSFEFAGSRLHAQGGCNGVRGAFLIDADGLLVVTGGMSTMMACAKPLMEADAALSALLAEPLEPVLVASAQPTLALLTEAGEVLVLTGELTPEARFGAPARVFLEVAARTVACAASPSGDGRCLQVRERAFDEQGLLVGAHSEWRAFDADIEGYQHEPGIRNV